MRLLLTILIVFAWSCNAPIGSPDAYYQRRITLPPVQWNFLETDHIKIYEYCSDVSVEMEDITTNWFFESYIQVNNENIYGKWIESKTPGEYVFKVDSSGAQIIVRPSEILVPTDSTLIVYMYTRD